VWFSRGRRWRWRRRRTGDEQWNPWYPQHYRRECCRSRQTCFRRGVPARIRREWVSSPTPVSKRGGNTQRIDSLSGVGGEQHECPVRSSAGNHFGSVRWGLCLCSLRQSRGLFGIPSFKKGTCASHQLSCNNIIGPQYLILGSHPCLSLDRPASHSRIRIAHEKAGEEAFHLCASDIGGSAPIRHAPLPGVDWV